MAPGARLTLVGTGGSEIGVGHRAGHRIAEAFAERVDAERVGPDGSFPR